jgi:hypothetical protein
VKRAIRKRAWVYSKTRAEAKDKLDPLLREVAAGVRVSVENWNLETYLWHLLETVVKPNRAAKTYQGYEIAVRLHIAPRIGKMNRCGLAGHRHGVRVSGGTPMEPANLQRARVTLPLSEGVALHLVRGIVGHNRIDVTMAIYVRTSLEEKRKAVPLGRGRNVNNPLTCGDGVARDGVEPSTFRFSGDEGGP